MPLNIDITQILLHMLNLVILFFGLYMILYKPVLRFMQAREEKYKEDAEKAKENLEKSEQLKGEYEAKLREADSEIEELRKKSLERIDKNEQEKQAQARAEADEIILKAKENARREHDRIIANANSEIKGLVEEAAAKLTIGEDTSDAYEKFLDDAERSLDEQH